MFFYLYDELVDNKQHCYYFQTNCDLDDIEPNDLSFVYNILKIKKYYGNKPDLYPSNSVEVGYHLILCHRGVQMYYQFLIKMKLIL